MSVLKLFGYPKSKSTRTSEKEREIARDPQTSRLILSELTRSSNIWVRSECALNRNLTSEEMLVLAKDPSFFVRYSLVHNENLCKKAVCVLDSDDDARVRLALAKLFKFSSNLYLIKREREILEILKVKNRRFDAHENIFKHDEVSKPQRVTSSRSEEVRAKEDIELMVGSELGNLAELTRIRVAYNLHTPQSIILSFIETEGCMRYVIEHVNCTEDTIRRLFSYYQEGSEDLKGVKTYEERFELKENGDADAFHGYEVSRSSDLKAIGERISGSPNTPPDILTILATSPFEINRVGVARNPNTPLPSLAALSTDTDVDVRKYLAINSKLTDQISLRLSQDEDDNVRIFLAQNQHTKSHILINLANDDQERVVIAAARHKGLPEQEIRKLHKHINDKVRANVAANLSAPADILSVLSSDSSDMVRERLAENINLDHDSYDLLSHDTSIRVLRAVKKNCKDLTTIKRVTGKINALKKSPQGEETDTSGSKLIFAFIVFFIGVMLMLNGDK
jgi:hypothetical protein